MVVAVGARILKFNLPPVGEARMFHSVGTRVLAIGWQGSQLVVWCESPDGDDVETRPSTWTVAMTGGPVPSGEYVGTAQHVDHHGLPYAVHVYRDGES